MNKDEIEQAVRDAEKYAAEDAKRREEVDARNAADQVIYQTEKLLEDLGDKCDASTKGAVQSKIDALRAVKDTGSLSDVKRCTDDLQQEVYKLSEILYKDAGAPGAAGDPNATQDVGGYDIPDADVN